MSCTLLLMIISQLLRYFETSKQLATPTTQVFLNLKQHFGIIYLLNKTRTLEHDNKAENLARG